MHELSVLHGIVDVLQLIGALAQEVYSGSLSGSQMI